jgi:hypothetical protein
MTAVAAKAAMARMIVLRLKCMLAFGSGFCQENEIGIRLLLAEMRVKMMMSW